MLNLELLCPSRVANVIFRFPQGFSPPSTISRQSLPLLTYLRKYSKLERLILDGSAMDSNQASLLNVHPVRESICLSDDKPFDNALSVIKSLRIHTTHQSVENSELNATMLLYLTQTIHLPNLRELHITMSLSWGPSVVTPIGEGSDMWKSIFRSLNVVVDTWRSLDVIRVCAEVILPYASGNERLSERFLKCNIWVSQGVDSSILPVSLTPIASFQRDALAEIFQAFQRDPACKIELCILYLWNYGGSGPPLDLFQQSLDLSGLWWTI